MRAILGLAICQVSDPYIDAYCLAIRVAGCKPAAMQHWISDCKAIPINVV
jgi:hypothetical protein